MKSLNRTLTVLIPSLLFAFSVAPTAEAQIPSLGDRIQQAGERVLDHAKEIAEERIDSTIAGAEDRIDGAFDDAEERAAETLDSADQQLEATLQQAEESVEGTIRCLIGDAECVEQASQQGKGVVLIEDHDADLQEGKAPTAAGPNVTAGTVFHAGDVLAPKIDNVQIHSAPNADAPVVGNAARSDEFVFLGDEEEGFVNVQGATLSGWVRKVLLDRR